MSDSGAEWEDKKKSRFARELKSAGYYLLLEHDLTGSFVALINKIGGFRQKWNLKFTLERRFVHFLVCTLLIVTVLAAFYGKNNLCIRRRHCLKDACLVDKKSTSQTPQTGNKKSENVDMCDPIPTSQFRAGDPDRNWFVFPRPTKTAGEQWTKCSILAELAEQPNVCVKGIVCLPACKGKEGVRTFLPDQRPKCQDKGSDVLSKVSNRDLENTLICVYPRLPCSTHEFSSSQRRVIVAAAYPLISVMTRLILVCSCVQNSTTRRHYRRLGYVLCILFGGVLAGVYAFILVESSSIQTILMEASISLSIGYVFQAVWIVSVNWFFLGSCPTDRIGSGRPSRGCGCWYRCRTSCLHLLNQICGNRRRAMKYASPFEGVMQTCGQKPVIRNRRDDSGSYDTVAEDEEWSDNEEWSESDDDDDDDDDNKET